MHFYIKAFFVATTLITLVSCQSNRQSSARRGSRTRTNNNAGTGRTLGAFAPLLGALAIGRPTRFDPISSAAQSDPAYGGSYAGYGGYGGYGGYPGYGAYSLFGGYPNIFSALNPFAYRPRPYYPAYGGYNPYAYAGYQRPYPYGSYAGASNGASGSSYPSTSTGSYPSPSTGSYPSTGAALGGVSGAGSTAAQAQIANQLGQALGASLRPLLAAGGGAGGAGAAGGAGGLASLLGLLG